MTPEKIKATWEILSFRSQELQDEHGSLLKTWLKREQEHQADVLKYKNELLKLYTGKAMAEAIKMDVPPYTYTRDGERAYPDDIQATPKGIYLFWSGPHPNDRISIVIPYRDLM